ncbi:DNA-3-methyladenine glycosylase I [Mammaliicoccus stepanovicii]|uniref:Putative DNA-3-methyladenine glycosidase n=1 Tax=Mammaliicoccus stepanovicii TaxID=643214 RepID=A0A240A3D5_9STAP|nr:DNA-3-methyladenine glycosylase I [Mammaliicoccus stepanovicii]PNZ71934.1 DNA-3-methyladenine glycosylase I [Mammaliicoccus stepanovicii]GGI39417.1 DNA-3-methyladenine glycosylase I [Mammaliicoccus stepanovicii]SNV77789.1 putative DNA-3-methyladenine glycosidase [Mammaliicoccus stepanovicii]
MKECSWPSSDLMKLYHQNEWCRISKDDRYIFEMLSLEGAQAGLSWETVIQKRAAYQEAFHGFDIEKCATLTDEEIESIKENYKVIKHIGKLKSVRNNALIVKQIQDEYGSFSNFIWAYVEDEPIINEWKSENEMPAETDLSIKVSKDFKKLGLKFVGPKIIYSFLQSIGIIDDHIITCPYHTRNR